MFKWMLELRDADVGEGGGTPEVGDAGTPDVGVMQTGTNTFKVKVDGQEKEVPVDELLLAYSKVGGAEKKFQEAAELRREADQMKSEAHNGIQAIQLYQKIMVGEADRDEVVSFCDIMNVSDADRKQLLGDEVEMSGNNKETQETNTGPDVSALMAELQALKDKVNSVEQQATQAAPVVSQYHEKILEDNLKNLLDKDPDLVYIIDKANADKAPKIVNQVLARCKREVIARIQAGAQLNPMLLDDVVRKESSSMKEYGDLIQSAPQNMGVGGQAPLGSSGFDSIPTDKKIKVAGEDNIGGAFARRFAQLQKLDALKNR